MGFQLTSDNLDYQPYGKLYVLFIVIQSVLGVVNIIMNIVTCAKTWEDEYRIGTDIFGIYSALLIGFSVVYWAVIILQFVPSYHLMRAPFYAYVLVGVVQFIPYAFMLLYLNDDVKNTIWNMAIVNWRVDDAFLTFEYEKSCVGLLETGDNTTKPLCNDLFISYLDSTFSNTLTYTIVSFVFFAISFIIGPLFQMFYRIFHCIDFKYELDE
ncbi:hypothetical protein GPJ56_005277 [Histomonas meleagridis]|uniref:uncharacterized protein n=1 Tax=Histomonas meleagridis TaxID=135588 RepID=UPI0035594375|nr:hypothetical protein GPJ56_005277 [Histomonas meleagridis]KAH0802126.1 hypothetical protein GO595_005207 [Histomonas meleagridis]